MTIRELARLCGVSNATVSLALRGHPRISASTRERIVSKAEEYGYRTPPMVSALLSHVRARKPPEFKETIALLTTEPLPLRRRRPYHRAVANGAMKRAAQLGYAVDSIRMDDYDHGPRLDRVLESRGIRGLIVDASCQGRELPALSWHRLSCALVAHDIPMLGIRRVVPDHYHNMELLLRQMMGRGYARIGYYSQNWIESRIHGRWTAAYLWLVQQLPMRLRIAPRLVDDWDPADFLSWVAKVKPDAVVTPNWMAVAWLREKGYRVPQDIGIAVPNWNDLHEHVTGIDQDAAALGAAAIDIVTAQLTRNEAGPESSPRVTSLQGTWREGNTLWPEK